MDGNVRTSLKAFVSMVGRSFWKQNMIKMLFICDDAQEEVWGVRGGHKIQETGFESAFGEEQRGVACEQL